MLSSAQINKLQNSIYQFQQTAINFSMWVMPVSSQQFLILRQNTFILLTSYNGSGAIDADMSITQYFKTLEDLDPDDPKRLLALDPSQIRSLLDEGALMAGDLFHIAEDLIMLKRNSSSVLPDCTKPDQKFPLQQYYPKWAMTTTTIKHNAREAQESQVFHLVAARAYEEFIESMTGPPSRSGKAKKAKIPEKPVPHDNKTSSAFPTAQLRDSPSSAAPRNWLAFTTNSSRPTLNTRVEFMDLMRAAGFGAEALAVMTYQQGDPIYDTRDGLLGFLTDGSPKLRLLFHQVHDTCYVKGRKLLVVEDVPICAKFYEDSLRAAWVHAEVLQSKLSHKERQKLIDDFNDPAVQLASPNLNSRSGQLRYQPAVRILGYLDDSTCEEDQPL